MLGKLTNTTQLKRTTTNDSTSPTMTRQNDNDNCRDCSENAECTNQGEEKCVCKAGFVGNGQTCTGMVCLLLFYSILGREVGVGRLGWHVNFDTEYFV